MSNKSINRSSRSWSRTVIFCFAFMPLWITSIPAIVQVVQTTVVPYLSTGYKYEIVPHGADSGFEQPGFDDSAFSIGDAGFGTPSGICPLNNPMDVKTNWPLDTDILLRKTFQLPFGATNLRVDVAIDNDVQVLINGQDISNGLRIHDNCASRDSFVFSAPDAILIAGTNLLAVRARDRGSLSYVDLSVNVDIPQICVPPPPDMVSWWPGDGDANDIVDSNQGTPQNGATFAAGMVGQAFTFDGIDDFVNVPDAVNLRFGPTSPITVDLWAFRTGTTPVMHLVGKRSDCSGGLFNYQMALNTLSGQGLQFGSGFGPGNEVATGIDLPLNTWTHLAGTFDGTTFRFYINGALVASAAGNLGPANTAPLKIGGSGNCATFGGLLDEVEIFNRALSASEIQAIYNAGSAGKCKPAAGADLSVTKTASPDPVLTGSNITYTITVANNGPGAATNVTVTDDLPASTSLVSCSSTGGGVCDGSGNNRTVTFTSLTFGASATVTLVASVNCSLANGDAISNTVTVTSSAPDPDLNNNSATANVTASNPPPDITNSSADPSSLWPPDHKMVDITVNYDVMDNCEPASVVTCTLNVSSNEPINGTGDGDTAPDWEIVDAHHVRLRAERAGNGSGRIYTVTITCTDSAGNSSSRYVTVRVPISQGQN